MCVVCRAIFVVLDVIDASCGVRRVICVIGCSLCVVRISLMCVVCRAMFVVREVIDASCDVRHAVFVVQSKAAFQ